MNVGLTLSKFGIFSLLFGLLAVNLFAQKSTCDLKVNVFSYKANAPIERAKVNLTELKSNTILQSSFIADRFNGISSGNYKVEIASEGYGQRIKEFKVDCNFISNDGVFYQSVYLAGPNDPNPPPQVDEKGRGVIKGVPLHLETPVYPVALRGKEKLSRNVVVSVLIDEDGNVISGEAVNEDSMFGTAAVKAAMGAKFQPVRLGGKPTKVSGIVTYNFVP